VITVYIIKDKNTGTPYLTTLSKDDAQEWLEIANEGGCRSMGWRANEYKIEVSRRPLKERFGAWQF